MGGRDRPGRHTDRSADGILGIVGAGLRSSVLRNRASAFSPGSRNSAPGDRHDGSLLLAMHHHLRGSGSLLRALHEASIMSILTMLWKNFWGGSRTLLFPQRPKVTQRFRGLVQFDPELCTGCAICKFRCTSRA